MTSLSKTISARSLLRPVRQWLEDLDIQDAKTARFFCQLIPSQCPFERNVILFGHTVFRIPPLCKLNPFYAQIASLRFKSLSYLADTCDEDITLYC